MKQPAPPNSSAAEEASIWRAVVGTWRPLHGSFFDQGFSVEWHDFWLETDLEWGRSFHLRSVEVCLNFSGTAELHHRGEGQAIGPNQLVLYATSGERRRAVRHAGVAHRFLTLELAPEFFRQHFAGVGDQLKAPIRSFMQGDEAAADFMEIQPLPAALLAARTHFVDPPVPPPARATWYLGRTLEILAQAIFRTDGSPEFFCERHRRTNRERIDRVRYLIERDLENPPTLDMLAAEVGCSPFHLSRIFTQETGVSFPKFLRMKRIEKAAEMLRAGRMNVTEVAMAVGYSSISAFNRAFVDLIGCCPGLYPDGGLPFLTM